MRAVCSIFLALFCASACHGATCASVSAHPRDNDKKYEAKKLAGDRAFRKGKYQRAESEYREALAYQDEVGAYDIFFKIGETKALLGQFDKAYSCLIESGSSKSPTHRIVAEGLADPRAQQAAQILLDTIQTNTPRYPYATFPEYLALAAIYRKAGLVAAAELAEGEGRINRRAAEAWEAAMLDGGKSPSLAAADHAAMEVYEKAQRPVPAEILRAQAAEEPPLPKRRRSF
jgi:tetratricopeptide (TPR) repeat protein